MVRSSMRERKMCIRLGNRVIAKQRMKNECHHHVKEPRTFCKAREMGALTVTPRRKCLTEKRPEFIFGQSSQTIAARVVRMRYPRNM